MKIASLPLLLKNKNKLLVRFILAVLYILSSCSIFLLSSKTSGTWIEYCANEITNAVINQKDRDYLSVLIEPNKNSEKRLESPSNEFFLTYGAFGEANAFYAGVMNGDKKYDARINEIRTNESISFLYAYNFYNYEYKGHYIHEFYPIELKFRGYHDYGKSYYFCYISETQANSLLSEMSLEQTEENYQKLLGKKINITVDHTSFEYTIGNIYLEQNYYYETLKNNIGTFVISGGKPLNEISAQACYFMSEQVYKNKYFFDRILKEYSSNDFNKKVNTYNLGENVDYLSLNNKLNVDIDSLTKSDALIISMDVLLALVCVLITTFLFLFDLADNPYILIGTGSLVLLPYLVFYCLYSILKNVLFFSGTACIIHAFLFLIIFSEMIVYAIRNHKKQIQ